MNGIASVMSKLELDKVEEFVALEEIILRKEKELKILYKAKELLEKNAE